MDILQMLVTERDRLNRAIEALGGGTAKRRGRPAKGTGIDNPVPISIVPTPKKRKPRKFTAAQRKAASERMAAYWRKRHKAAKKAA